MKKHPIVKDNIYNCYHADQFENAIQYANQNSNIDGVDQYCSELLNSYHEYQDKMGGLLEQEEPILDDEFKKWKRAEEIKNICKWTTLICAFIFIVFSTVLPHFLTSLTSNITFLGIIVLIIYTRLCNRLRQKYTAHFNAVSDSAAAINQKCLQKVPFLWQSIDNLYLNSLDPMHRENILMRRDQERQHQERMEIERQNLQIKQESLQIKQESLQSQKRMEEEQRRTRDISEQMLQIEKEREARRGYY